MKLAQTYWQVLDGQRKRAILTIFLLSISGVFEGLSLVALIPVLNALSPDSSATVAPSGNIARYLPTAGLEGKELLVVGLGIFVLLGVFTATARALAETSMLRLRARVEESIRLRTCNALLSMSWPHFLSLRMGDLSKSMISEGFQINMGCHAFLDACGSSIIVLILFCFSFSISLKLTLFTILFGLLALVLYLLIGRKARKHSSRLSGMQSNIGERINDIFANLKFYRASGRTNLARRDSRKIFADYAHSYFWSHEFSTIIRFFLESGAVIFVICFIAINHFILLNPVSSMLVFLSLFYRMSPRLLRAQEAFFLARTYLSWYETFKQRLENAQQHVDIPQGKQAPTFKDNIDFKQVSYQYPQANEAALQEITLQIRPGECLALVGASGSGKSSFLDLILGLLHPVSGTLQLDGVDLTEIDLDSWRSRIGLVSQESPVFYGSVLQNIAWSVENPDRERARQAAQLAHADEFIQALPQGYDTIVGERGGKLSGGQRQRLAIARALYQDPLLLILDEATSALDGESEAQIQQALHDLKGKFTIILVAHRLKTVQLADRILVLEHGRLVEQGTWQNLTTQTHGLFKRMVQVQGLQ